VGIAEILLENATFRWLDCTQLCYSEKTNNPWRS